MTKSKKEQNSKKSKVNLTVDELQAKKTKLENELLSFNMSLDPVHIKSVQNPTQLMREFKQLKRQLAITIKQKKQEA